jgi:DNA-binding response OmpR family regulator
VLIVEDEIILALEIEQILERAGFAVTGIATRTSEALRLLAENFEAAVLDVTLADGTSAPVAQALTEKRVPFIVLTAYSSDQQLPAELKGARYLQKPLRSGALIETLRAVLATQRTRNQPKAS